MNPPAVTDFDDLIDAAARAARRERGDAVSAAERRVHRRLSGDELAWIRQVRLKNGPELAIVDLSSGGALLEGGVQMRPGSRLTLELGASRGIIDLPSEVLRCGIARLDEGSAVYRGACMFTAPLAIDEMLNGTDADAPSVVTTPAAAISSNWHRILVRYRDGGIVKGFTIDFHPGRSHFSVWPATDASTTSRVLVLMSRLKAVAFLEPSDGRDIPIPGLQHLPDVNPGRPIEVTFIDREVLRGVAPSYRPQGAGFFLRPIGGTNARCLFIARSAVRHVRFQ